MSTEKPSKCYSFSQLAKAILIAFLLGGWLSINLSFRIAEYVSDHYLSDDMPPPTATANEL